MDQFGFKDALDILLVATLLYYMYKMMKDSGSINIFIGVLAFIIVWVVLSEILEMRLIGTIMDKFMNIGLLVLVILFQDQIKMFLVEIGSHKRWGLIRKLLRRKDKGDTSHEDWVLPIVYACKSMSRSRTGALIVIQQNYPLEKYERLGDKIDADVNSRLIENIFFKNSPLHDGAMIIVKDRIMAAGCILPVSHDANLPRELGLRHRSALGITQQTDALVVIVSEETGNIAFAHKGQIHLQQSLADIETRLSKFRTA